jgi:hypothetical protein
MFSFTASSQDTIYKTNGERLVAVVTEIGTNGITYKRFDFADGPTFIENKSNLTGIRFRNGQWQDFTQENIANAVELARKTEYNNIPKDPTSTINSTPPNNLSHGPSTGLSTTNVQPASSSQKKNIECLNGKYTLNGQKIGKRELDRTLSRSKNPAVLLGLKTAKTTKVLQKIVGITSIPSTIGGGVTSLVTLTQFYQAYQKGNLTPAYYWNAGLSLVGTLTVPVTNKILKKKKNALYDKVIDLYNISN